MEGSAWQHQIGTSMAQRFAKDESWIMSTNSHKSLADYGSAEIMQTGSRPQTVAVGMRPSTSAASLGSSHAALPSLRIKERGRDPLMGCMPSQVAETREWQSTSHRIHRELPRWAGDSAGQETRFGIRDHLGKIHFLPTRYGTAEALGTTEWLPVRKSSMQPSSSSLRKSPSAADLEKLLARRSRAKGRGGRFSDVSRCPWTHITNLPMPSADTVCHPLVSLALMV